MRVCVPRRDGVTIRDGQRAARSGGVEINVDVRDQSGAKGDRKGRGIVSRGLGAARAWGGLMLAVMILAGRSVDAQTESVTFRLAFTKTTVGDIAYNDAVAALRVWTATLVEKFPVKVEPEVSITGDWAAASEGFRVGKLDGLSLSAEEFLTLGAQPESFFVIQRNGSAVLRYVMLARKDSGLGLAEALGGKVISFHRTAATCLVPGWVEGLRAEAGASCPLQGRSQIEEVQGASKAVLRVFFRQAEVCVATESAFALACELNPQVGTSLKVLATSPDLIPSAFVMHQSVRADLKETIFSQIDGLNLSSRGKQVLVVFQGERLRRLPLSDWEPTLRVLNAWRRLRTPAAPADGSGHTGIVAPVQAVVSLGGWTP